MPGGFDTGRLINYALIQGAECCSRICIGGKELRVLGFTMLLKLDLMGNVLYFKHSHKTFVTLALVCTSKRVNVTNSCCMEQLSWQLMF